MIPEKEEVEVIPEFSSDISPMEESGNEENPISEPLSIH